jgi:outer membrane lipoprotein-sorting protein
MNQDKRRVAVAAGLILVLLGSGAIAQEPSGREIVERVENLLWSKTMQGEIEMTIKTPRWERTLGLRIWMDRPTRSFVRILSPAKEAGIGSLRIRSEMWNYLPNIERTIKIPPSMMLQPWMGSDFTNDDLVKESSVVDDYTQRVVATVTLEGRPTYQLEAIPKPEAPVVWGKIVYWVRKADFIPLKEEFYDERGELVRVMTFSDVRPIGGRTIPTRWEIRPSAKPENATTLVLKTAVYDRPIDPEVFSQRNLQKP